tara:strand:+ start:2089 stop:2511 length:423 start_codon:yes stop_codon:yes gene_type:complete
MKKSEIINFLSCTYCRIKKSDIHGIGVCAIIDISKDTNLFPDCSCDLKNMKAISKEEVHHLNAPTIKMMSDFFIETKTHYFTTTSLNKINISYFLNHSDNPNCEWREEDDSFRPLTDIKEGEELTLNYHNYLKSELIKNV